MKAGTKIPAGTRSATVLPDMDFETYSEAGYVWDEAKQKWRGVGKNLKGLSAVGAPAYSEHPSTEVLSLAYDLKDGLGDRLWLPGMAPPQDLIDHIGRGGLIEAHNSAFEYHIWRNVCTARIGWPALPYTQLRCSMAKSRAWSLPGALGKVAAVLGVTEQKDKKGDALLRKLSVPRNPTKKNPRLRLTPEDSPEDFLQLYDYGRQDIKAESAVSIAIPDLLPEELDLWLLDQKINFTGVHIDKKALDDCLAIVGQAQAQYTAELQAITSGTVQSASEIQKIVGWLGANGVHMTSLDADAVESALKHTDLPPHCARVLEIRASLGAASVKKLYAIDRRLSADSRLRDLFAFCGADRTARWAGRGPQPQNLPNSGPEWTRCTACGKAHADGVDCKVCGALQGTPDEWSVEAVEAALVDIATRNLAYVERIWGDAVAVVAGCLRGLFSAASGGDLICSDFSAIEAVVLAALAGETWRMEVFRTHGKIYEMSAAKISGVPFEDFIKYKEENGSHHPLRKKIGKVAELASGYQGGIGAWKAFGADAFMSDDEIRENVKAWRQASPSIVNFWYGLENSAVAAVQNPGQCFQYRGITYGVTGDVLYCKLLSGRLLSYHRPRLHPDTLPWGKQVLKLTYEGWNSDYKKGPTGWMRLDTYGGKLCENVVQATARDILAYAMVNIDKAGYPIVLHVHDEIVAEVAEGTGSVEEFERIMATMPAWCADWPIRAAGGWRGKRYRKD